MSTTIYYKDFEQDFLKLCFSCSYFKTGAKPSETHNCPTGAIKGSVCEVSAVEVFGQNIYQVAINKDNTKKVSNTFISQIVLF